MNDKITYVINEEFTNKVDLKEEILQLIISQLLDKTFVLGNICVSTENGDKK